MAHSFLVTKCQLMSKHYPNRFDFFSINISSSILSQADLAQILATASDNMSAHCFGWKLANQYINTASPRL